jgi:hypothetical protein
MAKDFTPQTGSDEGFKSSYLHPIDFYLLKNISGLAFLIGG